VEASHADIAACRADSRVEDQRTMVEETESNTPKPGDPRAGDRRRTDRRRQDRRLPVPLWRRPWALVLYGIAGTLLIVALLNRSRPPQIPAGGPDEVSTIAAGAPVATEGTVQPPEAPPVEARRMADYERLMAEGDAAKGRWIRVELYCGSITQVSIRATDRIEQSIAQLADAANRVPAAECRWGPQRGGDPRADVFLLVPPALADRFADAPVVDDGFVPRRRVVGTVEWIGRSDAMALRTAVVLRE
jgi:hypothetical protein